MSTFRLQKFKLNIANTVITQDNSSLKSMGTDQLLDLFSLEDKKSASQTGSASLSKVHDGKDSMKNILENMEDLWDEKQYENEYSMDSFLKDLNKSWVLQWEL